MSNSNVVRWGFTAEIDPLGSYVTYHDYMMLKEENDRLRAAQQATHDQLTDDQCEQFRRMPCSFNDMVRAIFGAGAAAGYVNALRAAQQAKVPAYLDIPPFLRRNPKDAPEGKEMCPCGANYIEAAQRAKVPDGDTYCPNCYCSTCSAQSSQEG